MSKQRTGRPSQVSSGLSRAIRDGEEKFYRQYPEAGDVMRSPVVDGEAALGRVEQWGYLGHVPQLRPARAERE